MDIFIIIAIAVIAIGSIVVLAARAGRQQPSRFDTPESDEYWKNEAKRLEALWASEPKPSATIAKPIATASIPQGTGGPRHEFLRSFICAVAGESFANADGSDRQALIAQHAMRGRPVTLRAEQNNAHDSKAVAVLVNGYQIGYLSRDVASRVQPLLFNKSRRCEAIIEDVHGGAEDKPRLGVTLHMTIYKIT